MALKYMRAKSPGERTTVREISEKLGCPTDVTARVLQAMGRMGVVSSEAGVHGGYWLTKDLARLTVLDLMQGVLGPIELVRCLESTSNEGCELRSSCNIVTPVTHLQRRLIEFYRSISIAEILEPPRMSAKTQSASSVKKVQEFEPVALETV